MTVKLFLFDLDGTLLLSGGAGMRAMEKVFLDTYNLPRAFENIIPDGKIDPMIFREIFLARQIETEDLDSAIEDLHEKYIVALREEMPVSEKAEIMPGIPALLEKLSTMPDSHLGLVTGNFERGAYIKLDRFDLNRWFSFGAFGSDHEDRSELVRIAVKRASEKLRIEIPMGKNIYVIGDTPRDVECGLANGSTTVAVATGNYSTDALEDAGAHLVFDSFEDVEDVLKKLY